MQKEPPKGYLLLHNISKKNNIGNIIRSACAFGLTKIFYISNRPQGSKKMKAMKEFHVFGNQGTYKQIEFQSFPSLQQAKKYLQSNGIRICGVEIGETSKPIHSHPFKGPTAFFLGNQGSGIIPVHRAICDDFVYIPQYTEKTASLNVSVAAGIVFHHFGVWAQYPEAKLYGEKYQLQEEPIGQPKKKNEDQKSEEGKCKQKIEQDLANISAQFEELPFENESEDQNGQK